MMFLEFVQKQVILSRSSKYQIVFVAEYQEYSLLLYTYAYISNNKFEWNVEFLILKSINSYTF